MYRPQNLRIPGPTFVPQTVLNASARPMINHRGPEFAALMAGLTRALQEFLNTEGDVFLLTASGSGGMEAAIVSTLSSGDRVLLFVNGAFYEGELSKDQLQAAIERALQEQKAMQNAKFTMQN